MKDSGINAIGKTPASWKITKIKNIASLQTGDSIRASDKNKYTNSNKNAYPYIATKDISLSSNMIDYNNGIFIPADNNTFKIAKENSILLCIEGGSAGKKIGFTNQSVSFVNKLCNLYSNTMNNKFLFYYFLSPAFTNQFKMNITGLIGGVSLTKLKGISISLPLQNEQQRIVNYLDKKTSEINSIVEKTKESIEELKAYKQSLITETVTKGLNPDAPMKDSGIEWIDKIPENWRIGKLKYFSSVNDESLSNKTSLDYKFKYIDIGSISLEKGIVNYEKTNFKDAPSRARRIVKDNDIIISTVRTYLKAIAVIRDSKDMIVSTGFAVIRPKRIKSNFLSYYLKSDIFTERVSQLSEGIAYPSIASEKLINIKIIVPDEKSQLEIGEFLDIRTQQIDTLINKKQQMLKELESYKQSLIYEYVTGKKEVE